MPAGRPTLLTPSLIEQVEAIAEELPHLEMLAAYLRIHRDTIHDWCRKGDRERKRVDKGEELNPANELHMRFSDAVKGALSSLQRACLKAVRSSESGWQAKAWILERRWPELWGSRSPDLQRVEKKIDRLRRETAVATDVG